MFDVGRIVNTQGVRGEMRVISFSDDPNRFESLKSVFVCNNNGEKEYKIKSVRYHKQFVLIKLEGIDDMNAAESLKTSLLRVPDEMGLPLEEGEYYIRDIYDCEVFEKNGEFLGIVADIIFTGANDVYVVRKEGCKDLLLPAIKDCILEVNVSEKKMIINLMEGLRD